MQIVQLCISCYYSPPLPAPFPLPHHQALNVQNVAEAGQAVTPTPVLNIDADINKVRGVRAHTRAHTHAHAHEHACAPCPVC